MPSNHSISKHLETLTNDDLKEICRGHNLTVGGSKADLTQRVIEREGKLIKLGRNDLVSCLDIDCTLDMLRSVCRDARARRRDRKTARTPRNHSALGATPHLKAGRCF